MVKKYKTNIYEKETVATLSLALPIVAAQLANISLGFIDTVMAGNLSTEDLGAVAIGRSLYAPIFVSAMGVLLAVNPLAAQYLGAGEVKKIGKLLWQGTWLALILALPCMAIARNVSALLPAMSVDSSVIPIAAGYLEAISWSIPALLLYFVFRFLNEGLLNTRPNMFFALIAIPINVFANYVLMYGKFGFPRLGAVGAGWATTLIWWINLIGLASYTFYRRGFRRYDFWSQFRWPDRRFFSEMLRIGIPNGISFGLEISMFAGAAIIIGSLGAVPLASHQIALNFASITFMVPLGISIATTARVGYAAGRQDPENVRTAGWIGVFLSTGVMVLSASLMLVFPTEIVSIYTNDQEVIVLATHLLLFAAIFQISDGLQVSASGALRGLKDTTVPMIVNSIAYWAVGLTVGYHLAIHKAMGASGFWIGMIAGLTVSAVLHPTRFYWLTRQKNQPALLGPADQ